MERAPDPGEVWRYTAQEEDRAPCCMVTEGAWTWFGSILLTLFLLAVFNLKYYRKVVGRPKNLQKEENEKVLKDYLLAHQKGTGCQLPTSPISIQDFKVAFQDRLKHVVIFKLEFSAGISIEEDIPSSVGRSEQVATKNRNQDIVPFDYNRLTVGDEYINASLCSGLNNINYIVTQGPLNGTVSEFWNMIWNENVPAIAMLTKTFDFIKVMCVQYWPSLDKEERYDQLFLRTLSEKKFANFVERRILLRKNGEDERVIVQFQYTEWACHGFPVNETLLDFRRRFAETLQTSKLKGPCVVHCNEGAGRSGVFVLLDYNIRLIETEQMVDICSKFSKLRRERMGLISTEFQYRLVYTLINRFLQSGFQIRSFPDLERMGRDGVDEDQIKDEFALISGLVRPLGQGECAGAHREDNRGKNRDYLIVPPDAHRTYITSFQGNTCTDYINAVFVDGFIRSKEFIVTEWPLNHTISDFWSMIYDHEVSTIVVLEKMKGSGRFPIFWPEEQGPVNYGPVFSVERSAEEKRVDGGEYSLGNGVDGGEYSLGNGNETSDFSVFNLDIRRREVAPHRKTQAPCVGENQGRQVPFLSSLVAGVAIPPKRTKLFKIETWPAGVLSLLHSVKDWEREQGVPQPVCVVSGDGVGRVGVYTLLSYCRDQILTEKELNIIQGATTIKSNRPNLLRNLGEYKLVYQLLNQIIKSCH